MFKKKRGLKNRIISVESLNSITKNNPNGYGLNNNNYPFSIDNINMNMKNNIDNLNNKTDKYIESEEISQEILNLIINNFKNISLYIYI